MGWGECVDTHMHAHTHEPEIPHTSIELHEYEREQSITAANVPEI